MSVDVGHPESSEDFPFIKIGFIDFRKELYAMHVAITELKLWEFIRTNEPPSQGGYMMWQHENIIKIKEYPLVVNCGLSGRVQGECFRYMQYIACLGWESFKKKFSL